MGWLKELARGEVNEVQFLVYISLALLDFIFQILYLQVYDENNKREGGFFFEWHFIQSRNS